MSPRWRKIWADLTVNKSRTLLVILSIVVGVFAVGSITGTSAIIDRESKELWQSVNPASAVIITTPFDLSLAEQIAAMPEVDTVQVRRVLNARLEMADGTAKDVQIFSVPDYQNMTLNLIQAESGAFPPPEGAVLIERSALSLIDVAQGDTLTITLPDGTQSDFEIGGIAYDLSQPAASVLDVVYAYVSPQTMQQLTGDAGYNTLQFRVSPSAVAASGMEEEAFTEQVANMIRDSIQQQGVIVVAPPVIYTPGEPPGYIFIVALLVVLGVVGSLTFVLSGFLIVNIISALLVQQTRQIGVMKAVGARTSQVVGMYLGMALFFGVAALIIALPLSFLGARLLAGVIGDLNNYKITDFSAPPSVFVVQIVIGLVVPVASALIPVILGTRVSVREALDSRGIDTDNNSLFDRITARIRGVPRPILLSFRNTFRQKGRLILTLMTLTLAGAIFATVFTVRNSLFATLDDYLRYENYSVSVELDNAYDAGTVVQLTQSIENVTTVETWTQVTERFDVPGVDEDADITMFGLPTESQMILPIMQAGTWIAESDVENGIVINSNVAEQGFGVGDTMTIILRGEPTEWQVVGVAQAIFSFENIAWTRYDTLASAINEVGLARILRMDVSPNDAQTQAEVVERVSQTLADADILVNRTETFSALESSLNTRFNVLVISLLSLALLLAVVGGLGIAGTTSINVIERMREIGVMRSVGAANYQILGIFIVEAVFVGMIGWFLGSLLALPISKTLSDGVGNAFSNAPLTYSFDVSGAVLWLVLAIGLAVLFSYLPSRRASKLTLREVLSYEG
ncbi:MAG: ABC transporter permease [Chloroflexi bacterium]|nr:MAG: ABC transporter permease [Chloroflexota bacterium]